jgi:adenylosuccinate lyase
MEAARGVKIEGKRNDLLNRCAADPKILLSNDDIKDLLDVKAFVGRSPEQTREFISLYIDPLLARAERYGTVNKMNLTV